jgi:hypothetical protein
MREARHTKPGHVNRNGQAVTRSGSLPGVDKSRSVCQPGPSKCATSNDASGSDIHLRLCPKCLCGPKGLPHA